MNRQMNIREFKRLEREIAKSEADVEAMKWRQAELAAIAADDGMTQREYAAAVGNSQSHISKLIRVWHRFGELHATHRFADAYETVLQGADEIVSRADAARRRSERLVPTRHDDRIEMAEKLLADRSVAEAVVAKSSEASRRVQHAVHEKERERSQEMFEQYREHQEARARAMPGLPAHMAAMVMRVNEWSAGLADITDDDLSGLPEGRGRELVGEAIEELIRQATRWRKTLKRKATLHVIEGKAMARG